MDGLPYFIFLRYTNTSNVVEADKIPLNVRCDCCSIAAKAMESDSTNQWDNICLTTFIKCSSTHICSFVQCGDDDLYLQQKAKQIYEAQKKNEEMTEAESEELALRRSKF